MHARFWNRSVVLTALAVACWQAPAQAAVSLTRVASGLDRPVFVTAPPGDSSRLFIVEQHSGRILILNLPALTINATPFLTVSGVSTGNEQGLLGLAFHPDYGSNGYFYVDYTGSDDDTRVQRFQVSGDPNVADAGSAFTLLEITQPQANHNGGWIGFGPDSYLYISTGDGGGADDQGSGHTEPGGNAQDTTGNLLGKILRIDVDGDDFPLDANRNYAIPPSNPFVGSPEDDEIWAFGLRNPWRCSFDRLSGDFYIGDVGQHAREEIDVQPAGSSGGTNYGWRLREGTIATPGGAGGAPPVGGVDPVYNYAHGSGASEGFAVTGGYVYRGPIATLQGHYFFADYATENIWSLKWDGSDPASFDGTNFTDFTHWTSLLAPNVGTINQISAFGEDADGNLYIVDLGGELFRLDGAPLLGATDHFMFYKVGANSAAPSFDAFGPVVLADQFRTADYDVHAPRQLGLPADKNSEGVTDASTHLEEYKLKESAGTTRFERLPSVTVLNQCNAMQIAVNKPVSLLVPTAKSLAGPVAAPDPLAHNLDHFLCYRAKQRGKLPRRMQVDAVDQFQARRYDLKKVTKLCAPVAKSGTPIYLSGPNAGSAKSIDSAVIRNPGDHLLCYKATLARSTIAQTGCLPSDPSNPGTAIDPPQPRHTARLNVYVNNQFGAGQLDSKKEVEICVPSVKILPP